MTTQPYLNYPQTKMANQKSLFWTYVFWLFGGFLGLHHFYLGRDRHAFAVWISFGGYFGVGLFREMWRIPEYVADANEDPQYMAKLVEKMRRQSKPSFGIIRYFGAIVVADILGYLVMGAIPHELIDSLGASENLYSSILNAVLVPFGCAIGEQCKSHLPPNNHFCVYLLGVHLVGNIGRHSGSFKYPLVAAYLTSPFYLFQYNVVFLTSVVSLIAFVKYSLKWRRTYSKVSRCKRYTTIAFITLLYCSLWVSWFYFNCSVTDKNEENIKCRDALTNFFNSPAWLEFRSVMSRLVDFIRQQGIFGLWREIVEALDPQGENNALKLLELTEEEATQEAITLRYRKLARQWHPDKHQNADDKKVAEEKFMAIQQAYDLLSKMKQRRHRRQSA